MTAPIRVGTCSWADETLTKVWYPPGVRSGEARLRHYAERFGVVEANSTYYRLPDAELVGNWVERTPPGFMKSFSSSKGKLPDCHSFASGPRSYRKEICC